ncbi:protein FAM98A-like [Tubulanus polymorphus]|uniref:protein FAM98A-like n=1 Tax=Tubulanus polymorphus TaxID=672921 RepID=UPI003DA2256D
MENDILDTLEDLGYQGALVEDGALEKALEEGPRSIAYTQLVEWLVKQLAVYNSIEDTVNAVIDSSDAGTFLLELSGFLREYGCPHGALIEGPINDRLSTRESRLQLLDFLQSELCACRIIADTKPHLLTKAQQVEMQAESEVAAHLKLACMALRFPKPPADITPFKLFSKIESKVKELMASLPTDYLGKPLLNCRLSEKQWNHLMSINSALTEEYQLRREMVLKRLDVTIQSFMWSERAKAKEDKIASVFQPLRTTMNAKSHVSIASILSARDDLTRIKKTSSGTARENTKCAVNRVLIGKVPDRGGRAWELEPPPPEMPSFMKRQDSGRGGRGGGRGFDRGGRGGGDRGGRGGGDRGGRGGGDRGGRGGRGGGGDRGGRVQGSWSGGQQGGRNQTGYNQYQNQGGHNQNQGGYSQNQGGYSQNQGGYSQGGYSQSQGGYSQGGYNQNQRGYSQNQGGYSQGGYNQNQGGYGQGGGFQQGYQQPDQAFSHEGGYGGGRGQGRTRGGRGGRDRRY